VRNVSAKNVNRICFMEFITCLAKKISLTQRSQRTQSGKRSTLFPSIDLSENSKDLAKRSSISLRELCVPCVQKDRRGPWCSDRLVRLPANAAGGPPALQLKTPDSPDSQDSVNFQVRSRLPDLREELLVERRPKVPGTRRAACPALHPEHPLNHQNVVIPPEGNILVVVDQ
jgi:hypothetical protein